jgi:hypothetical protein
LARSRELVRFVQRRVYLKGQKNGSTAPTVLAWTSLKQIKLNLAKAKGYWIKATKPRMGTPEQGTNLAPYEHGFGLNFHLSKNFNYTNASLSVIVTCLYSMIQISKMDHTSTSIAASDALSPLVSSVNGKQSIAHFQRCEKSKPTVFYDLAVRCINLFARTQLACAI